MTILRVKDVMTHLVVTLRPEDMIPNAVRQLAANRISGAPVVEDGKPVGVVSEADLTRAYAPPARRGSTVVAPSPLMFFSLPGSPRHEVHNTRVGDVMTRVVVAIGPEESVGDAASLIDRYGVRRLPVVDGDGYVIGILARSDLVRAMARSNEATSAAR